MDASIVDKDLIERINKGEEKAFEVLYNSYFVYLCACANSYIFNSVEAQDIVNETSNPTLSINHLRGYFNFS